MVNARSLYRHEKKKYGQLPLLTVADDLRMRKLVMLAGQGNRILDLGCGEGWLARLLKENGNDLTGLDFTTAAVHTSRKKGIKTFVCNVETDRWPVKNSSFDVVVAAELIEHILDTDTLMKKIRRVLKPGGRLIISTPNTASLGRRLLLLFGRNPYLEECFHKTAAGHVRYFVREGIIKLLKRHSFVLEKLVSDTIVILPHQWGQSALLANIFPTLGKSLIVVAKKK
jgi:2-polyprenyl-3-methyl-5-hydroxy-6-metoxy-1,4-benzoquinol methylase